MLGELHVPVDRHVIIELSSKDVIHNFCLPSMRIAQDAIPGQVIPMWFKPIKTGTYEVVCGQLCGLGHYGMKGSLVVDTPAGLSNLAEGTGGTFRQPKAPPAARPPGEPPEANTGHVPPRAHQKQPTRAADKTSRPASRRIEDHKLMRTCPTRDRIAFLHRFAWFTAARDALPDLQRRNGHEQRRWPGRARLADHVRLQHVFLSGFEMGRRNFLEHTHRLIASIVGLLTIILAVWLWRVEIATMGQDARLGRRWAR